MQSVIKAGRSTASFLLAEGALPAKRSITTPPTPVSRWPQLSF